MSLITKIEQHKNENMLNIYINNKPFIECYKEFICFIDLKVGMIVDDRLLKTLIIEEMIFKATDMAIEMLDTCFRTELLLRQRLLKYGFSNFIIDKVMLKLKEHDIINDNSNGKGTVTMAK